jgi:hypothetical protein
MTIWAEPIGKQHKHGKYTRKGVAKLFAFAQTRPGWLGVIFLGALVHRDSTPVAPSCPRRIAASFITSIARFHSLSRHVAVPSRIDAQLLSPVARPGPPVHCY